MDNLKKWKKRLKKIYRLSPTKRAKIILKANKWPTSPCSALICDTLELKPYEIDVISNTGYRGETFGYKIYCLIEKHDPRLSKLTFKFTSKLNDERYESAYDTFLDIKRHTPAPELLANIIPRKDAE